MLARKLTTAEVEEANPQLATTYAGRHLRQPVPRYELPKEQMPAQAAYQIISDELNLDGNPVLNLASFVTTWMEPEADKLMAESFGRNYIDADEYPQTTEIHNRCVNMLARLFHAPEENTAVGCATVGSSEAIHLAGLALKWRWRARRQANGLPTDRPNIVMGGNVQVCWEKFARYFDVEPRYVPLTPKRFVIGTDDAMALVDENTIGVVGILGSTYTGEYEPIEELNDAIVAVNKQNGWDVGLHVDGASGAFVAPFTDPKLAWDFRLPAVVSINASGHKYGLVYPGVGWVIWRKEEDLPNDLIFHVNYLGGDQPTFNLNFSRGAGQVLAQYYNFLRLGHEGYSSIMKELEATAAHLSQYVASCGPFEILSKPKTVPLVCFRLKGEQPFSVFDISDHLRQRGWIVPAYTLAPDAQEISVLRVVVKENFSRDMADLLAEDLGRAVEHLSAKGRSGPATQRPPLPSPIKSSSHKPPQAGGHKGAKAVC